MAEPSPWQAARPQFPKVRRQEVYVRDPYNFSATSVSQGDNNPVVPIPAMGRVDRHSRSRSANV
jgi:hypothetical protein